MSLCLYLCMSLYISLCFVFLLVPSCVFLLFPFSFAFGPFLLPVSFVVSLLCFFFSSSVFFFLSVSSLPPRSVFVSCVRLPLASFLALLSSPSCSSFFLSFLLSVATSPFPPYPPLFLSFLLQFSFAFLLFLLFLPSFLLPLFSCCPVLLLSPLSLLLLFLLFLVLQLFLFFVFSSFIACFFLSFCYPSSSVNPPLFCLFFFSFSLGFVSLSVIRCSFFRFLFCLLLSSRALRSSNSFLSLSLLASIFFGLSSFCHFSWLLPSFLPSRFSSSAACIPPRFVCRLLAVRFRWYLPAHHPPSPPSSVCCLCDLRLSFFCSGLPPLAFLVFLPIPSILLLPCLSFFLILVSFLLPWYHLYWVASHFSFTFVCSILFGCSGLVSVRRRVGGVSPVLFVFTFSVYREGVLRCLALPPSRVFALFFILLSVFLCHSVFALY